jgi:hypothetical protein
VVSKDTKKPQATVEKIFPLHLGSQLEDGNTHATDAMRRALLFPNIPAREYQSDRFDFAKPTARESSPEFRSQLVEESTDTKDEQVRQEYVQAKIREWGLE